MPEPGDPDRFRMPRSYFSRFVRSGGTDRSNLGRAVSGYVSRSLGGPRTAARSMGASRRASARILSFLSDAVQRGSRQALAALNLDALAGRPIEDVFKGLADHICPEGGTDDAAIARDAFVRTIVELAENGVTDLDTLTADQILTVFESYATTVIEERLYNDIGANAIELPATLADEESVQAQLRDFIRNCVSDALRRTDVDLTNLRPGHAQQVVDRVYERAYELLVAMGEAEAEEGRT